MRREAAPHLRYLKKQVDRAERSIEVKKQLTSSYTEYLKREDLYIAHHHDRLTEGVREPGKRLEEVNKQLQSIKELLTDDTDDTTKNKVREAQEVFNQLTRARQQAEQAVSSVQGQVQFLLRRLETKEETTPVVEEGVVAKSKVRELLETNQKLIEDALQSPDAHVLQNVLRSLTKSLHDLLASEQVAVVDTSAEDREELGRLQKELGDLEKNVAQAVAAEEKSAEALREAQASVEENTQKNHEAERDMFALREEQRELQTDLRLMEQELTALERDREDFKRELQEAVVLIGRDASQYFTYEIKDDNGQVVSNESIVAEDRTIQHDRRRELEKLKIRLEELGVGDTEELLKEFNEAKERDEFLANELSDLQSSVENLRSLIVDLQEQLRERFISGIDKISVEFNRFFTLMFGGGSASLSVVKIKQKSKDDDEIEEEEGVPEEGVELQVSLPNKRVKGLNMLSGGERALVSIAVIFAMSQVNPPPFIILDETDAALDEANSRRYGDMIEELAKRSQLVLITHNRETMSRAGILYGITMGVDGVSKLLSVKFEEAAAVAK